MTMMYDYLTSIPSSDILGSLHRSDGWPMNKALLFRRRHHSILGMNCVKCGTKLVPEQNRFVRRHCVDCLQKIRCDILRRWGKDV